MSAKVSLLNSVRILTHNNDGYIILLRKCFVLSYISCFYKNLHLSWREDGSSQKDFPFYGNWCGLILFDVLESLTFQRWRQRGLWQSLSWHWLYSDSTKLWRRMKKCWPPSEERLANPPIPSSHPPSSLPWSLYLCDLFFSEFIPWSFLNGGRSHESTLMKENIKLSIFSSNSVKDCFVCFSDKYVH